MSFLAPLYALGALAISLPILFHLIRRTPRGRTIFSSLMFLTPSPPRITRRSRLEHLLLLLLRAAAVLLLALAFARPFFRETAQLGLLATQNRQIAILVDTSASMQRGDIWQQVRRQIPSVLADVRPGDDVALFAFDEHLNKLVDFDAEATADVQARVAAVRRALLELRPGWTSGDLGHALSTLADQMDAAADRRQTDAALQIHLFSDLQDGAPLEALQDHEWPKRVYVQVHAINPPSGNAGLQEILDLDDARSGAWRVRVSNDALADQEQFALQWLDAQGQPLDSPAADHIYVPSGQDRVLQLKPPDGTSITGIRLVDDAHEFDNTLYLAPVIPRPVRVVYAGVDSADDTRGMQYYLQQALQADPRRTVNYAQVPPAEITAERLRDMDLLVLGDAPPVAAFDALVDFATAGGWIVAALRSAEQSAALPSLLGVEPFEIREAELSSYAMLSNINFDHPLFARLADARYNDFTKIRFWKMRELLLPDSLDDVHVLATFDNDRPALIERLMGDGGLLVLASTWSPDDSQLALSTKFIPLVAGWLNAASPLPEQPPRRFAGQTFELAAPFTAAEPITVDVHHESPTRSMLAEINERPIAKPGHYRLQQGEIEQTIAVNVAPAESRTAPIDPAMLEQFGVRVGRAIRPQDEAERQRQLRDRELEKRQQVWRWLIAAALVLLVTETWIAGYLARRVAMQTPVHGLA